MRIVFMGTPEFAVPCLERIIDDGYDVVGVYTQPDKPRGRGHKLTPPPVKEAAIRHNIPVFQPTKLKTAEAAEELNALMPDMCIVVAYGRLLPPSLLAIPRYGCINVHGSLLPKYRGAAPIQWSVLNGEKVTGITTMYMAEGLDTGDMLLSKSTEIGENETSGELHDRLMLMGADLLSETIKGVTDGSIVPKKQDDDKACYAPMLSKELSVLDFAKTAAELHRAICGLSPWPCAETLIGGKRLKIYKSRVIQCEKTGEAGELIDDKQIIVATSDKKALLFEDVQLEGSRRMNGEELLRGHHFEIGTILGK